jgi:DNA-binding MarR family transcriptional regulator
MVAKQITPVEALKDAASRVRQSVQWQLDERQELAALTEKQREEIRDVESLVSGELMSSWTRHQSKSPAGNGTNVYFSMSPVVQKLILVGHAVSPHADNHYLRVIQRLGDETDLVVLMQSKVAQRLFETLAERAKLEGTSIT